MYAMVDAIGGADGGRRKRSDGVRRKPNAFRRAPTLRVSISYKRVKNQWKRTGREDRPGNVSVLQDLCVTVYAVDESRRRSEGLEIGRKEKKGGKRGRGRKRLEKVSR